MKIKIELDLTPDEAQDLFVPSSKQKEFAQALYKAYIDALTTAATGAVRRVLPKKRGTK
jgi:hypothetical protein